MAELEATPTTGGERPRRTECSSSLTLRVETAGELLLQIAAADSAGRHLDERLELEPEAAHLIDEITAPDGSRTHRVQANAGRLRIDYRVTIEARPPSTNDVARRLDPYEEMLYIRPSRYCPSDHLIGFATSEFGTTAPTRTRIDAITEWIHQRIAYLPNASTVHDSAEDTLLTGAGTCRDFAHLGVALCRAVDIPARFVSVYAPQLEPMDFHAVFEAADEGEWWVYDATRLAPRAAMVRIATGRDAADAAFLSTESGAVTLEDITVSAISSASAGIDDPGARIRLD